MVEVFRKLRIRQPPLLARFGRPWSCFVVEVFRKLRLRQPPLLARQEFRASTILDSLVVEVPGIEPGSFRAQTGLLRV